MYKKQEVLQLKKDFWTSFGQYMSPVLSAGGEKINWINYKTGIKNVFFRMDAGNGFASVAIELTHADPAHQEEFFDKLAYFRGAMEDMLGEKWEWTLHKRDEHGKPYSSVSMTIHGVNIFDRNSWPLIISFLKPRIIVLDKCWAEIKEFINDQ